MNVEEIRDYCLSLGEDVEEKFPFTKFKKGDTVLVFYVCQHMFCFFDIEEMKVVSVKCQSERIPLLKEEIEGLVDPYNESKKHWLGIQPNVCPSSVIKELIQNSYQLVKSKYSPVKK